MSRAHNFYVRNFFFISSCRSYRKTMMLGGVIYLHDISQDRLSTTSQSFDNFRRLCGDAVPTNVVLGTTKWKRISPSDGIRREEELKRTLHWKEMIEKGTTVCPFRGSKKSAWDFIHPILNHVEKGTYLEIQRSPEAKQISDSVRQILWRLRGIVRVAWR